MAHKTINTIEQIRNTEGKVYVRWSKSIDMDIKRGYSLRFGTQAEAGLSVCEIDKTWEDWRIIRQLQEYRFTGAPNCWIITGRETGRGGDNEPLLSNIEVIGKAGSELTTANWQRDMLVARIAQAEARLAGLTDAAAISITEQQIAKMRAKLEAL